jgi:branched-chain amino acid transport system permease protein
MSRFATSDRISLHWPWWLAAPVAILVATLFGTLSGALSVRTEGIYTIMITLAIASAFYYFTHQNYTIFNGSAAPDVRPVVLGVICAILSRSYCSRWPVGSRDISSPTLRAPRMALQGIWDNLRRMTRSGSTSRRTAWRPTPSPGSSPPSAACSSSGTTR